MRVVTPRENRRGTPLGGVNPAPPLSRLTASPTISGVRWGSGRGTHTRSDQPGQGCSGVSGVLLIESVFIHKRGLIGGPIGGWVGNYSTTPLSQLSRPPGGITAEEPPARRGTTWTRRGTKMTMTGAEALRQLMDTEPAEHKQARIKAERKAVRRQTRAARVAAHLAAVRAQGPLSRDDKLVARQMREPGYQAGTPQTAPAKRFPQGQPSVSREVLQRIARGEKP